MSTIKNVYDNVEDIPTGMESVYTKNEETGSYQFNAEVEGMVSKTRLDEFRDNNVNLRKEVEGYDSKIEESAMALDSMRSEMKAMEEKFSGVDMDEWASLQAERKAMAEKELIEAGDVDKLINSRVDEVIAAKQKELQAQKEAYEHQVLSLQEDLVNYDGQLSTMLIDNEISKIASRAGVQNSALDDVLARGRSVFRVEDGQAMAFNGEGRQMYLEDAVTPLGIDGWVEGLTKSAPHLFESSQGAGTPQPTSAPAQAEANLNTHDAILAGLASLDK